MVVERKAKEAFYESDDEVRTERGGFMNLALHGRDIGSTRFCYRQM